MCQRPSDGSKAAKRWFKSQIFLGKDVVYSTGGTGTLPMCALSTYNGAAIGAEARVDHDFRAFAHAVEQLVCDSPVARGKLNFNAQRTLHALRLTG